MAPHPRVHQSAPCAPRGLCRVVLGGGSPLTSAHTSTVLTLPHGCEVLQGRAASVGAPGSTGGAQEQVPRPGEENRLVAAAAGAGSHPRDAARENTVTGAKDCPAELPEMAPTECQESLLPEPWVSSEPRQTLLPWPGGPLGSVVPGHVLWPGSSAWPRERAVPFPLPQARGHPSPPLHEALRA